MLGNEAAAEKSVDSKGELFDLKKISSKRKNWWRRKIDSSRQSNKQKDAASYPSAPNRTFLQKAGHCENIYPPWLS